jgi:hypothetical protein
MATISKEDEKLLKVSLKVVDLVFRDFNKTICANCPDVEKYNRLLDEKQTHRTKEAGCCAECAKFNGFFDKFQISEYPKELPRLKDLYSFDQKYGFFDISKHCCKLPRIERSSTCLKHCCHPAYEEIVGSAVRVARQIKQKYHLLY